MSKEYKGYNGILVLNDDTIVIKRGLRGFLLGGGFLRGDKTIPYSSIVAVQLKRAGLVAGYLQLTLKGGSEAKGGLFQSTTDENSVHFHSPKNKIFEEAKSLIEERISTSSGSKLSKYDELAKLKDLKDSGVLTDEEFNIEKGKLLG
jgi:hypothetical protein